MLFFRLVAYLTHKYSTRLASRTARLSSDPQLASPSGEKAREEEEETTMFNNASSRLSSHTGGAGRISSEKEREEEDEGEKNERGSCLNEVEEEKEESSPYSRDKFTILVHCTHGVNRTGLFLSLLMMSLMNCSAEFAVKAFETKRGYPFTKGKEQRKKKKRRERSWRSKTQADLAAMDDSSQEKEKEEEEQELQSDLQPSQGCWIYR